MNINFGVYVIFIRLMDFMQEIENVGNDKSHGKFVLLRFKWLNSNTKVLKCFISDLYFVNLTFYKKIKIKKMAR